MVARRGVKLVARRGVKLILAFFVKETKMKYHMIPAGGPQTTFYMQSLQCNLWLRYLGLGT